jgi:hypothetical protein
VTSARARTSPGHSTGRRIASNGSSDRIAGAAGRGRLPRFAVAAVFVLLLIGFAAGLWGTLLRPPAYEVRGTLVARPAANLLLVRHDAIPALGMREMDLMAVFAEPALVDRAAVEPGARVRMGVRAKDEQLTLLWIERVP